MTPVTPLSPLLDDDAHYADPNATSAELVVRYQQCRTELEQRMAEPVPDAARIDKLIGALELLQLAIKDRQGVHGNNPNE